MDSHAPGRKRPAGTNENRVEPIDAETRQTIDPPEPESGVSSRTGPIRVELWVRSGASVDIQDVFDDYRAALQQLADDDIIVEFSLCTWGKRLVYGSEGPSESASETVEKKIREFEAWAEREGHSLEPAFQYNEISSLLTDETRTVIRLPLLCIAVYEKTRLKGVFPCSRDGETRTVANCLERLRTEPEAVIQETRSN